MQQFPDFFPIQLLRKGFLIISSFLKTSYLHSSVISRLRTKKILPGLRITGLLVFFSVSQKSLKESYTGR